MCAIWKYVSVMSVGLAVLGLVNAITIDNHLLSTKNDCYERLALGQRLDPRDVTRSLPARTAAECQAACSEEDQRCLSLSFGISPQGNGTCELSYAAIRETADLQPIGTIRDTDFDLYIKKVDCKLIIPYDPPASDVHKPTYAVAVLDRPSSDSVHGYEVQESTPRPPPRRPETRPPDVFIFHGDRPGTYNTYQNYYDVPRPFPLPYGPDRDQGIRRPALNYPNDEHYYYGMHRPSLETDRYKPYKDYYNNRPQNTQYDSNSYLNTRPANDERPFRPDINNPNNPNLYDDRIQSQSYRPESNRRNPYPSGYDNTRPILYEPENRPPYRPYSESNYPVRRPVDRPYEYEHNHRPSPDRPYRPQNDDKRPYQYEFNHRPYRPQNDENRPYEVQNDKIRPIDPYKPDNDPNNRPYRPLNDNYNRPYDSNRPLNDDIRPYERPYEPNYVENRPNYNNNKPYGSNIDDNRLYGNENIPYGPHLQDYYEYRRPITNDKNRPEEFRPYLEPQYGKRPGEKPYNFNNDKRRPDSDNPNYYGTKGDWDRLGADNANRRPVEINQQGYGSKPQNLQNASAQNTPQGGTVTSIITQIVEPCYRRTLPGKRIAHTFIRRAVPCERVEDCQRECQEEKRFVCEGFNYRLDASGRGQGDCELTDHPLSRMDSGRDVIPDRDYDFYEKDRNSGPDCRPLPPALRPPQDHGGPYGPPGAGHGGPYGPPGGGHGLPPRPPNGGHGGPYGPPGGGHIAPYGPSGGGHGGPSWSHYPPPPPPPPRRPALPLPPPPTGPGYYGDRRKDVTGPGYYHGYHISSSDRDRYGYHYGHHYPTERPHYPPPYYGHYSDHNRNRGYWGLPSYGYGHSDHGHSSSGYSWNRSHFVPYRVGQVGGPHDWGRYGGSYGGEYTQNDAFNYWGFGGHEHYDTRRNYLPHPHYEPRPHIPHAGPSGPPHYEPRPHHPEPPHPPQLPHYPPSGHGHGNHIGYDGYHPGPSYPQRDDCSTRRGMGFRLHKGVVKKFYAVPNIHECERLCYREKDFECVSFSFRNMTDSYDTLLDIDDIYEIDWTVEERVINVPRYAITLSSPTDNCYLSDRPYKDLDFYTELEPDRDFDIYTMHRTQSCLIPVVQEESECFLRVRSGQRLDSSVVKDSIDAKTIVECQLECLTASRFTCRSFSYRWGPPHRGGAIDSCQLSDWPFAELDPRRDLVPEPGYEVYERGSYGHGCEHNHFDVPSHHGNRGPGQHIGDGSAVPKYSDKICYVGYAKPARLTPDAAKGALSVSSELDCKAECTRAREQSGFQCMSFSYRNIASHNQPNCELSDVEQRDLRPELDYHRDPDSWLFAWDNLSPQCTALLDQKHGSHGNDHTHNPLDTWRVYSVSGWPCRRGTTCQENREAGFWSCELEGGDVGSWDYCCRPDHHCGYSQGYNYPWCYVGPSRDQWRTCSDRYYPYLQQQKQQQHEHQYRPGGQPYLPHPTGHSTWHAERPYRPPYARPAPGPDTAHRPSLNEYEDKFHQQFLEPPQPGGLGRHWPVSYLHKETPPNANVSKVTSTVAPDERQHRKMDNAISNVVQAIQAADLNNTRYHATNQSDGEDDVLFVRLPMPTTSARLTEDDHTPKFDVVDTKPQLKNKNSDGFDELFLISPIPSRNVTTPKRELSIFSGSVPTVRRGTITRTNRTARRRRLRPKNDLIQFLN